MPEFVKTTGETTANKSLVKDKWGSALEYFVTTLGFAVGLGNVWRFPYKVYSNGGAVFLIPYGLALLFLGVPLQMMEASIGQYAKKGPVEVWEMAPLFRGIGMASVYVTFIGLVYYNTPISWASYYFIRSMSAVLPWSWCDTSFAIHPCIDASQQDVNSSGLNTSSAVMFFYQDALKISDNINEWGTFVWPTFVSNLILWAILFAGVSFGAKTLGKLAYFTSLFPYVMLTVMVVYTALLPGSLKGIQYYLLDVDWKRLAHIDVWRDAIAQVFYSTGCASGVIIQLASFNRYDHNILRDTALLPLIDGLSSVYAGFAVFATLGFMAETRGVEVADVVSSGPGLIFVTYAEAFSQIEGGNVWAAIFFLMVVLLGLSSQLPCLEMCCAAVADAYPRFKRSRLHNLGLRIVFSLLGFGFGTIFYMGSGYYWYYIFDELPAAFPLLLIGLAELICIGWIYSKPFSSGGNRLLANVESMIGRLKYTKWFWIITWTIIGPLSIAGVLMYDVILFPGIELSDYPWSITAAATSGVYVLPQWSVGMGWLLVAICPALMIFGAIQAICCKVKRNPLMPQKHSSIVLAMRPSALWLPALDSSPSSRVNSCGEQQEDGICFLNSLPPSYQSPSLRILQSPYQYNVNINNPVSQMTTD